MASKATAAVSTRTHAPHRAAPGSLHPRWLLRPAIRHALERLAHVTKNYSVSWFGAFSWPNLIAPNEAAFDFFKTLHHLLSKLLFAIASVHVLAALKHHFWNQDEVLVRMLPDFQSENKS
jgi:hypothetical protein